ncbi:MAG: hypothetical protein RMJ98_22465, partial [Myxococcales bacterium]|nr:hypothetical protein [Myxococcales bacterium]
GVGGNGGAGEGGIGGASGSAGVGGTGGTGGTAGAAGATVAGQSCADPVKVKVEAGKPLEFSGSTAEAKNNFLGYCNAMYDARDQVFEVTSTSAGKLSAKVEPLDPKLDVAIYAHKSACLEILLGSDTNGGKGACSELSGAGVAEALSPLSVEAGAKTYVYVDTNSKNGVKGGPFQITFALELFSGKNPSEGSELYFGLQLSEGDHLSFREVSF